MARRNQLATIGVLFLAGASLGGNCDKDDGAPTGETGPQYKNELRPTCGSPGDRISYYLRNHDACEKDAAMIFGDFDVLPAVWKQDAQNGLIISAAIPEGLENGVHDVHVYCREAVLSSGVRAGISISSAFPLTVPCPSDAGPDSDASDAADTTVVDTTVVDTKVIDTYIDDILLDFGADTSSIVDTSVVDTAPDSSILDTAVADTRPADSWIVDGKICTEEICDGIDNNCDGKIDEGCPTGLTFVDFAGKSPDWGYTGFVTGGSTYSDECPSPTAAVSICGRYSAKAITAFGKQCSGPTLMKDTSVVPYKYSITTLALPPCTGSGATTGTTFNYQCPLGEVIRRVIGSAGTMATDNVTQIQVECVKYGFVRAGGNVHIIVRESTTLSPVFGPGGGTPFDWTAPDTVSGYSGYVRGFAGRNQTPGSGFYMLSASARAFTATAL